MGTMIWCVIMRGHPHQTEGQTCHEPRICGAEAMQRNGLSSHTTERQAPVRWLQQARCLDALAIFGWACWGRGNNCFQTTGMLASNSVMSQLPQTRCTCLHWCATSCAHLFWNPLPSSLLPFASPLSRLSEAASSTTFATMHMCDFRSRSACRLVQTGEIHLSRRCSENQKALLLVHRK